MAAKDIEAGRKYVARKLYEAGSQPQLQDFARAVSVAGQLLASGGRMVPDTVMTITHTLAGGKP